MTESEFVAMVDISLPYGFEKCPTLDDYTQALEELHRIEAATEVESLKAQLRANYAQQAALANQAAQNQQAQYSSEARGQWATGARFGNVTVMTGAWNSASYVSTGAWRVPGEATAATGASFDHTHSGQLGERR